MKIRLLASLIAAYFTLGPTPDPPDPSVDPPAPDADLEDLDLNPDPTPDPPAPDPADPDAMLRAATARAEAAEKNARESSERLAALERQRSEPAPRSAGPNVEQQQWEEEERRLKDPAITAADRWYIESNRSLRASRQDAAAARLESMRASDSADFSRLLSTNPVAKRYEKRVVEKQEEMLRTTGQFVNSRVVLKMLIGDDIVEGRVKSKPRAKPADGAEGRTQRSNPPSPRSDVRRGAGAQTEQEKRRARLENVHI